MAISASLAFPRAPFAHEGGLTQRHIVGAASLRLPALMQVAMMPSRHAAVRPSLSSSSSLCPFAPRSPQRPLHRLSTQPGRSDRTATGCEQLGCCCEAMTYYMCISLSACKIASHGVRNRAEIRTRTAPKRWNHRQKLVERNRPDYENEVFGGSQCPGVRACDVGHDPGRPRVMCDRSRMSDPCSYRRATARPRKLQKQWRTAH